MDRRDSVKAFGLAMCLLCSPLASDALAQADSVFDGAPRASWIAPAGVPGDSFVVFHARRAFAIAGRPARFVIHVSADNRYRLFLNGEPLGSGPQRSDLAHWRYETFDLAPRLREGRNVLAAVVWNWGSARPVAQHSYRTGFVVQGDNTSVAAVVNTGPGWKTLVDSAYAPVIITNAMLRTYYASVPGESMTGSAYPWGWESPGYDDSRWTDVVQLPPKPAAPLAAFEPVAGGGVVGRFRLRAPIAHSTGEQFGWQLTPRSIPAMDEEPQALIAVRRADGVDSSGAFLRAGGDLVIRASARASVLVDQGHTTNAYPVLVSSGGAGSTVRFTYAEALFDSAWRKGNRDEVAGRTIHGVYDVYRPDGGGHRVYAPLYWRSYRYVQIDVETADQPLVIHDFHGVFTGYPLRARASFASDQRWIADVWRMDSNGARIGAFETYMDTPYYEQLQYVGDTRIQSLISVYLSGDDRLMRQAIEHFDASRIPEGLTTSRYPSALQQIIPPFSLIYVAMLDDYHMLRDDPAFVRERLAGVRGVLDWYARHVDRTGMLGPMPYWNYLDWARQWEDGAPPGAVDGHSTALTLLYAYALQRAARVERDLGDSAVAGGYARRADDLIRSTRARAWDSSAGLFRDAVEGRAYSQQTNVLAVLTGAAPAGSRRAMMERVLSDTTLTQATYYFSFYVLEALREAGLADRYVTQLAPWRDMLRLGLTSTPENPEPTRSDSHAWAAHPNYGLLATVLGVRPSSPGFRTVSIQPALGPLRWAEGLVPAPAGDIEVRLERGTGSAVTARITLPAGMRGEFVWGARRVALRPGVQRLSLAR